jgi:hypothetical protein
MSTAPLIDPDAERAALRLLLLCDRPSASQEVHLLRALRRMRRLGTCALAIYSEDAAADATRAKKAWIHSAIEHFRPHALLLSRFAGAETGAVIAAARLHAVPTITHLDDYLLEVPADLGPGKLRHHMRPERIAALTQSLTEADLLYISTEPLAARVRRAGFTTPIVVSALQSCADPDELAPPVPPEPNAVRIGYQGTRSHVHDLQMIAPALVSVLRKRPHATLDLFGTIEAPPELLALGPQLRRIPPTPDYTSFLERLRERRWHIGLGPLRPIEFNTFRTYTKWTEYAIAGAPMLASDCAAYRPVAHNGAVCLVADNDWEEALLAAIDNAEARHSWINAAQDKLRTEMTLTNQETQVLAMLKQAGAAI